LFNQELELGAYTQKALTALLFKNYKTKITKSASQGRKNGKD